VSRPRSFSAGFGLAASILLLLSGCEKARDESPSPPDPAERRTVTAAPASPPGAAPPAAMAVPPAAMAVPPAAMSRSTPSPACSCGPGAEPVVDPTLLAFLSLARAAHQRADLAEDAGDRRRAIAALEPILSGSHPGGSAPPPEVAEVIADARARRAELRGALGDFDGAVRDVDEGLSMAAATTYFRGHLYEVRGAVEKRRAEDLKAKGDLRGAERARAAALEALDKAIQIQNDVIQNALGPR
jgi:tetratricopeptide (TPR) repeat protein